MNVVQIRPFLTTCGTFNRFIFQKNEHFSSLFFDFVSHFFEKSDIFVNKKKTHQNHQQIQSFMFFCVHFKFPLDIWYCFRWNVTKKYEFYMFSEYYYVSRLLEHTRVETKWLQDAFNVQILAYISKFAAQMSFSGNFRYDTRLLSRNNILDPDFFLRSNDVLKFRIFWSVLVTPPYIKS